MVAHNGVEISISKGPEWERVLAELARTNAELATSIRESVAALVDPWAVKAEADVASMPIKGTGRQSGLRREVASGVHKAVTGTADKFDVAVTAVMPHGSGEENEAIIPKGMDRASGWKHPVFGNRSVWVTQTPLRPGWFSDAFDNKRDDVQRDIQSKLDEARDRIAGSGA